MADQTKAETARAARLFDVRRVIGGLFTVYGVIVTTLGVFDSQEEIDKAAGVHINLYAGIGMLIVGLLFLLWAFTRPLGQELRQSEEASSSVGSDSQGTRRPGDSAG